MGTCLLLCKLLCVALVFEEAPAPLSPCHCRTVERHVAVKALCTGFLFIIRLSRSWTITVRICSQREHMCMSVHIEKRISFVRKISFASINPRQTRPLLHI